MQAMLVYVNSEIFQYLFKNLFTFSTKVQSIQTFVRLVTSYWHFENFITIETVRAVQNSFNVLMPWYKSVIMQVLFKLKIISICQFFQFHILNIYNHIKNINGYIGFYKIGYFIITMENFLTGGK